MLEIAFALEKCADLPLVDIKANDGETCPVERCHERQADVTQSNDANYRIIGIHLRCERLGHTVNHSGGARI